MIANPKTPAHLTARMLGFAAAGLLPQPSIVQACLNALDTEPALAGSDTSRARAAFEEMGKRVLPEQEICEQARKEVLALIEAYAPAPAEYASVATAPRG